MKTVETACTYDCPDACSLLVGDDGQRLTIRGNPYHPITRGFVCQRIHRHHARLKDAGRLTSPLVRRGGSFSAVSWDEALDTAAGELSRALDGHGPASVVHVPGGGSLGVRKELVGHFFRSLGPVTCLSGGVCDETGEAAQVLDFGSAKGHDYTDIDNAAAVVLWGKDAATTAVHLIPFIRRAAARGAPVVLIDVLETQTANFADRYIRVAPGGDGFLALAVLRLLGERGAIDPAAAARCENFTAFEKMLTAPSRRVEELAQAAGTPLGDIEYLADLYASGGPVATRLGWGLQRRRAGGNAVRCIDALGLLSGHVGRRGGGVTYTAGRRRGLDLGLLARPSGRAVRAPAFARELGALGDPPARFVYLNGANPVAQFADSKAVDRALRGAGFVVVADAFMTDTAACADLVLPVTLMLEEDFDVVGSFGHHHAARVRKAVEPPAGVREDVWIVDQLRKRAGLGSDPLLEDPKLAVERLTAAWFEGSDDSWCRNPTQPEVPYADGFDTPSAKARLITAVPPERGAGGEYPLYFLTPKPRAFEHSQLGPEEQAEPPLCLVHPEAPGASGVGEGPAWVESPIGSLEVQVRHDPGLRRDICVVHVGGWLTFGRAVNALVEQNETDMGGGTAFYDQRVRLVGETGIDGVAG